MKQTIFNYFLVTMLLCPFFMQAQNVGIGTATPKAGLHIVSDSGFIAEGAFGNSAVLNSTGSGSRFIFYPRKGAIRGGYLDGASVNFWDDASTGIGSVGFGNNVKALGFASVALGVGVIAANSFTLAFGSYSNANGQYSEVIGNNSNANTVGAIAIGNGVNAGYTSLQGESAICIGNGNNSGFVPGSHFATGTKAFSIGNNCRSQSSHDFAFGNDCFSGGTTFYDDIGGRYAFSFGNSCYASGIYSFALGNNANTNMHAGSMVLGSRIDGVQVYSPADYHFLAQFAGGYQLQSNDAGSLGVYLQPNTSSWASLCDSTKKENVLLMDDDAILKKVSSIKYYSWKYKDDPDSRNRHYGIMAQDFYAAFGKDGLGKIGCDTLVNPIDLLGVAYSAIKALEKKTKEIDTLNVENDALKARLEKLEAIIYKNENPLLK
ncbi:MAG: tail fiber domain-containing protein [Chitinophagaceae bacterium]|nr:tail fiber domain-containing protein [Chitinophagaceae bacterium]